MAVRPHGEHPTMGVCDCDECQQYDFEESQMKQIYKAIRWENDRGWMELRFHPQEDTIFRRPPVMGHWKTFRSPHQSYHNTGAIVKDDGSLDHSQLDRLLHYALGMGVDASDLKDECLKVIGQELDCSFLEEATHDSE